MCNVAQGTLKHVDTDWIQFDFKTYSLLKMDQKEFWIKDSVLSNGIHHRPITFSYYIYSFHTMTDYEVMFIH